MGGRRSIGGMRRLRLLGESHDERLSRISYREMYRASLSIITLHIIQYPEFIQYSGVENL